MTKKHEEGARILNQKLDLHTDTSLDRFKQTALVSVAPAWNSRFQVSHIQDRLPTNCRS